MTSIQKTPESRLEKIIAERPSKLPVWVCGLGSHIGSCMRETHPWFNVLLLPS